ncbi:MAG TPA: glycosyltransferase family 39 protein, partial [Bryobacteraceae bacterium]|nr:glycosyltransferase family 39 protein [Bryobacteraceae bacterium]
TMAREGGWLTPRVLGRYLMQKPPLLLWLAGIALKIFGMSLWALRSPALAAAVCATAVVFRWMRRDRSLVVACAAAALLLSNPLWHIFARLCYTDMLWTAAMVGAMAILRANPRLDTFRSLAGFAASVAASVMVKSVAGLLPLFVLALYCLLARRENRPTFGRLALVTAAIGALAAPWHIYQLVAHRQWFWADYVQTQLLGFGFHAPIATSADSAPVYYFKRLLLTDPVLVVLALIGLPMLFRDRGKTEALLLALWLGVNMSALLVFGFRNLPYALIVIPPAVLIGVRVWPQRTAKWALLALVVIFAVKCYARTEPWGLTFGAVEPLPSVASMRWYHDLGRPNELIIANADDVFYSSTLGLPKVRYYLVDPNDVIRRFVWFYDYLGIMLSEDEFERLGQVEAQYAARLKSWGLNSTQPIGTTIVGPSEEALVRLVKAHPSSDYSVTGPELALLEFNGALGMHRVERTSDGRAFLLAYQTGPTRPVKILPARW